MSGFGSVVPNPEPLQTEVKCSFSAHSDENLQILRLVVGLMRPPWTDMAALFYSTIAPLLHGSGTAALCGKSIGGRPGCVDSAVSKLVVFGGRLVKLCRH